MTLLQKSLIPVFLVASVSHLSATQAPMSLKIAKQQFVDQAEKMKAVKAALRAYYEPTIQGQESVYEQDVKLICQQALEEFKAYKITKQSAVVFDIDETLLTDYAYFYGRDFNWSIDDAYEFRFKGESRAIKPVQEFYTALRALGYKLILLTSRRDLLYEITCKNLAQEGYVYDELILLPMDLFNQHVSHGAWKAGMRQELSKKYDLAGCVGDSMSDFEGDCCGIKVKLPNYLY